MLQKLLILLALVMISVTQAAERSFQPSFPRPHVDKSSHEKTVWSTANPWWPPNLSHDCYERGGPDYSWDKFSGDRIEMWKQVALRYHQSGLSGLQMETARYVTGAQETAEGFAQSGTGMTVIPFMQVHGKNAGEATEYLRYAFKQFNDELWKHKGFYRLNGRPVVFIYRAISLDAQAWKEIITAIESEFGNMIWLFDAAFVGLPEEQWLPTLRSMLQCFDGISMYGNWATQTQKRLLEILTPVMKKEFPEKIFEVGVHTNYTNHHWYGGVDPKLTSKYRDSWEMALGTKPDAISVTNWFDILENSRIMPSYELEDIRLKLLEFYTKRWRGTGMTGSSQPLIYTIYPTHVLLGHPLNLETLIFPVTGPAKPLRIQLELYASPDKKVRTMIRNTVTSEQNITVLSYSQKLDDFSFYLGLYPRLRYRWENKWYLTPPMPHTNLVTSIRPRLLYWARSNKRLLPMSSHFSWALNQTTAGETMSADALPVTIHAKQGKSQNGAVHVRILRNWRQLKSFDSQGGLDFNKPLTIPSAGKTLDWYNLELTNYYGHRYLTPPIWVHDGSRSKLVDLPVFSPDSNAIKTIRVQDFRIPFFSYECAVDQSPFILDSSGNEHHGSLAPDWRRGALYRTSYRYEHTSAMPANPKVSVRFNPNVQGRPALYFNGKGHAAFMGGTAFPYSFTYEMYICPDNTTLEQDFMGAGNGQIALGILPGGHIIARRKQPLEAAGLRLPQIKGQQVEVISNVAIKPQQWTHVAATYDLKTLRLFINGKLAGSKPSQPSAAMEWLNTIVIGGKGIYPYRCKPQFTGGIRKIRFYGRPLNTSEFWLD